MCLSNRIHEVWQAQEFRTLSAKTNCKLVTLALGIIAALGLGLGFSWGITEGLIGASIGTFCLMILICFCYQKKPVPVKSSLSEDSSARRRVFEARQSLGGSDESESKPLWSQGNSLYCDHEVIWESKDGMWQKRLEDPNDDESYYFYNIRTGERSSQVPDKYSDQFS